MLPHDQLTRDIFEGYIRHLKSDIEFLDERNSTHVEYIKRQHVRFVSFRVDLLEKEYEDIA
ncbi:hypothetical protein Hanom_Chr14g01332931 [Helianthus anomalus]